MVDNTLGAVGIPESGECLLVVVGGGADGGHHHRLAVATEVVLEQPGQSGVSVGDVRAFPLLSGRLDGWNRVNT